MDVEIRRVYAHTNEVELVVDGAVVYSGCFGGEPGDNCECRDHAWVVSMLEKAIKAERERCAKTCEDATALYKTIAQSCRARGNFAEANEWVVAIDCALSLAQEIRGGK